MAQELLAGPFNVAVPGAADAFVVNGSNGMWIDGVGLALSGSHGATTGIFVVQPDGTAYRRGGVGPNGIGWAADLADPTAVWGIDFWAGGMQRRSRISLTQIDGYNLSTFYGSSGLIRCKDRWLSTSFNVVVSRPLEGDHPWTFERYYPAAMIIGCAGISPYKPELGLIAIAALSSGGQTVVGIYDVNAKAFTGELRWFPHYPKLTVFARDLGVWLNVTAGPPDTIRVYADTAKPAALSAPTAVTPVTVGKVNKFRVRATGSNGEAVPNELVDWTASGGTLLDTQSTTDASGYAYARFAAPFDVGASINVGAALVI